MSNRSYRRLAVVAGAALAVGSMAPALAAHSVGADSTASAEIDVAGLTAGLPSVGTLAPTALVFDVAGTAVSTAQTAKGMVLNDVSYLTSDVFGIAAGLLDGVAAAPGVLVGDVLGMATTQVVPTALGLAGTGVGIVHTVPGMALGTAGGLVDSGLGIIDATSASGNVNVLASLMGAL